MPAITAIFVALGAMTVFYATVFVNALRRWPSTPKPTAEHLATGFITNFFDTLGIGSFAPSTAIFKFRNMVPDELIPGTLNTGHTLPVILQAFIYMSAIEVDVLTLVLLILSSVAGAWIGAGFVAGLPKRTVQVCMGGTLLAAVVAMLARQLDLFPAISTLGIGFYAPCMTLVSLLGMNPAAAFPIMMGSGAFLMPVASARFLIAKSYWAPVAAGLAIGGLAAVPLAAFVVKSLPLTTLRWLVIIVVLYAAVLMLKPPQAQPAH
jgi:uncharacterized membrane protein YfcA